MENPTAWIISVGNELLIGRIVNTNASWLAERLTFMGFRVERIITVPDDVDEIAEEVGRGIARARIVVTTGGLGPTYDDVTLEGVARAAGRRLVLNDKALEIVKRFYSQAGMELTEERVKMAKLPEGAEAIPNPVGAAPGSLLETGDSLVISLPGVPKEMRSMFEEYVRPVLARIAPPLAYVDCGVIIVGVPESGLAPVVKNVLRTAEGVYIKSHPKGHETRGPVLEIRALASAMTRGEAEEKARRILAIIAEEARSLGGEVGEIACSQKA